MNSALNYFFKHNESLFLLKVASFVSEHLNLLFHVYLIIIEFFQTDLKFFSMLISILFIVVNILERVTSKGLFVPFFLVSVFLFAR